MTTEEVANRLVELCRIGDYAKVYEELYHKDIVSIERKGAPVEVTKGMEGIKEKGKRWNAMIEEMHSGFVDDPIVSGDFFSLVMGYDCTFKEMGRIQSSEICVYEVQDGKVVKEQFFYSMKK